MSSERFAGVDRLYGRGAAQMLANCHVVIAGLGGVGSWVAEALSRSGVGTMTLIDGDEICVSNTNRQLHALDGQFGRAKVDALRERLRLINPQLRIVAEQRFLHADDDFSLTLPTCDLVVDAIDSLKAKVALIYYCRRNKIPIVVSGAAGGRKDPTLIRSRDLSKTEHDMLLGLVRRRLRDEYGWTRNPKRYFGVTAVYSLENVSYPEGCSVEEASRLDCSGGLGAVMHMTAAMAMAVSRLAIERLLKPQAQPESAST